MSRHRESSVWLADDEARCEPSPSPQCGRFSCGRYRAEMPLRGGTLANFNHDRTANSPPCLHWISAEMRPAAPVAARRVFKSMGG